jgi:Lrp/AsnC family transcriptional regulator for asnA, asnC and gidA
MGRSDDARAGDDRAPSPDWTVRPSGGDGAKRSEIQRAAGLSQLDRDLISFLQLDGRRSYVDLARALDIPEKRVADRVRELRETGVIHITTVADPGVLGYRRLAMLGLRVQGRTPADVARDLVDIEPVDYIILSTGRYDLFVELFCRDLAELRHTVDDRIRSVEGVVGVEIFPYLRLHYQESAWQVPDEQGLRNRLHSQDAVDEVDQQIVAELSEDGRLPLQAVADRLDISEAQVRRRLKRLHETGAVRVMAITNPFSLGYEAIVKLGISVAPGHRVADVADALSRVEETSYVALCTGRFDILSELVCVDTEAMTAVLDDHVRTLDGIAKLETYLYLGLHVKPAVAASRREPAGADDGLTVPSPNNGGDLRLA